jgi:ribosomal protein S18 acetylase RimI-like enzyme
MKLSQPRPYRDTSDLRQMLDILIRGRQAATETYYVHVGDLKWWLFYLDKEEAFNEKAFLWEDISGNIIAWALFSKRYHAYDVFPDSIRCLSDVRSQIHDWAIDEACKRIRRWGGEKVSTVWVSEQDHPLIELLVLRDFKRSNDQYLYLERSLDAETAVPNLPAGYQLYRLQDDANAQKIAEVSQAAFGSDSPPEAYYYNYQEFLRTPAGRPDQIIAAETPAGNFGSFAVCWLDRVNALGYFEPMGVHPNHMRKGLGRAVLQEGMDWMQKEGMWKAGICVEHSNMSAYELYCSLGFVHKSRLLTFVKKLD